MRTIKSKLVSALMLISLCIGTVTFHSCDSDNSDDADPCAQLECKNGGEKKLYDDKCLCVCPSGFTGPNCEIESDCPPSAECPIGQFANPANNCKCEPI